MHSVITIIAKYFIVFPVLLAVLAWLKLDRPHKKQFVIFGIAAAILTVVLAKLGGMLFYDTRPFVAGHFTPYFSHGNDNGFPSDHTLFGSLLAFVTLKYNRRLGWLAFGMTVLVGLARVIAGVHHLIDIIGAIVFAAIAAAAVNGVLLWQSKNSSPD